MVWHDNWIYCCIEVKDTRNDSAKSAILTVIRNLYESKLVNTAMLSAVVARNQLFRQPGWISGSS